MTVTSAIPRPAVLPPGHWRFPAGTHSQLDNGLQLALHPLPGQRLVTLDIVLSVPISAEPAHLEGVAAITARALREGTQRHDSDRFAEELRRHGISWEGSAAEDGLRLRIAAPARHISTAARLLLDALVQPAFHAGDVDRLVRQRLDQIRVQRAEPLARARQELLAAVFTPASRLSRPAAGSSDTVATITRSDVEGFFQTQVCPSRAAAVVAGDVDADAVADLIEVLTSWQGESPEALAPEDPVAAPGGEIIVVHRPAAVQTQVAVGVPGPDRRHPDFAALSVAAYVLGGTLTSRIDAVLREEKGYTYGCRANLLPSRRSGLLQLGGAVDAEVTGPALSDLLTVLHTFLHEGSSAVERDDSVNALAGATAMRFETAVQVAEQAASQLANDLPPDAVDRHVAAIRATGAEMASDAFRRHVDPARLTTVLVGDADTLCPALTQAGLPPDAVVPA